MKLKPDNTESMVKSWIGLIAISHKDTSLSLEVLYDHSDVGSVMEYLKALFSGQHCSTYTSMEYQKHVKIVMLYYTLMTLNYTQAQGMLA